jgi:predicted DNA-binding transcriptional regulator AlpA
MGDVPPLRSSLADSPRAGEVGPLVVDAKRLARLLGCGLRTVRSWNAAGRLPKPVRVGRRVFWRTVEICAWIDAGAPSRETWERIKSASLK